jgi:uncharacterized protein (TIGR02300 family)
MTAMTATNSDKAARGTKRTCQACEVRFYDLLRDPIVCPSCGALYVLAVQALADVGARKAVTGRAAWRHSAKRPAQVEPPQDTAIAAGSETEGTDIEAASDEVASTSPEDETVLVEQDDESDFAGLVELVENPKER